MKTQDKPLIKINNISKTYPGIKALDSIDFEIDKGEIHALVGENGAGKSTLVKILAGVEQPDQGAEIYIGEEMLTNFSNAIESGQRGISVIYQDFRLFPNLSVAENISLSLEIEKGQKIISWSKIVKRAKAISKEVKLIDIDVNDNLERLSIAKQQLVAIARALVMDAKLIIMDEPTSLLTRGEVDNLFEIINDLKDKGITTLFISHKLEEIFAISNKITVLRDGRHIGTYLKEELNEDKLISLMVGRNVELVKKSKKPAGKVLIEVCSISKKGNFKDISFKLHENEILSITGLVGSGRTEVAKSLFGLNIPDSGKVLLKDKKVNIKSSTAAMKAGISYIPENRQVEGLIMTQSIIKNITLSILKNIKNKFGILNSKTERTITNKQVKTLDIRAYSIDMLVKNLSGGNQQKVVLAKWLATGPDILIVDEPTNGIDVGAKPEIHRLLQNLSDSGMGILMISSELPEVLAISDRILVMRKGRISAEFNIEEATQEKILNKAL